MGAFFFFFSNLSQPEVPGGRCEINIGPALHHARPERKERERVSFSLYKFVDVVVVVVTRSNVKDRPSVTGWD